MVGRDGLFKVRRGELSLEIRGRQYALNLFGLGAKTDDIGICFANRQRQDSDLPFAPIERQAKAWARNRALYRTARHPCAGKARRSHRCIAVSCPRQARCCCKALAVRTRRAAAGSKASGESDIDLVRSRLIARRAKHFEDGQGTIIAAHRLAIDQAGRDFEVVHGLHD